MRFKSLLLASLILSYLVSWYFLGQEKLIESDIEFTLSDHVNYEKLVDSILVINMNSYIFSDTIRIIDKNILVITDNYYLDPDSNGYNQYFVKVTKKHGIKFLSIYDSYLNSPLFYCGVKSQWFYGSDVFTEKRKLCFWLGFKWLAFEFRFWPWE